MTFQNPSIITIMGLSSRSVRENKNSTNLKASPMSHSIIHHVAEPTEQGNNTAKNH
jgi:hypothetical protein